MIQQGQVFKLKAKGCGRCPRAVDAGDNSLARAEPSAVCGLTGAVVRANVPPSKPGDRKVSGLRRFYP